MLIWLVLPNLRTGIIGGTSLGVSKLLLHKFGDIEVSYLVDPTSDEDVGTFEIPVDYVSFMEHTDSCQGLTHHRPNLLLLHPRNVPFLLCYHFLTRDKLTSRSPPSANSIMMQRALDLGSKKASLYLIMKSELKEASNLT